MIIHIWSDFTQKTLLEYDSMIRSWYVATSIFEELKVAHWKNNVPLEV